MGQEKLRKLDDGSNRPLLVSLVALLLGLTSASMSVAQRGQVRVQGGLSSIHSDGDSRLAFDASDYLNARPLPLPRSDYAPTDLLRSEKADGEGQPGSSPGSPGSGRQHPEVLIPRFMLKSGQLLPQSADRAYGTSKLPFSTSRVDLTGNKVSTSYPYRPSGKLFFKIGASSYVCSGTLIKKGVVITAAHCVYDNVGGAFHSEWVFVPAYRNGIAPYGSWSYVDAWVWTDYQTQATCVSSGVICTNDIAVIVLAQESGAWAGESTGWLGYGWNGYGFTPEDLAQIKQLGYPVSHDFGKKMIETNAQAGKLSTDFLENTFWGSTQTGGSSGGPLVVNFGKRPKYNGTDKGKEAKPNRIVGVTSWGYTDTTIKLQGASWFTKPLVKGLVDVACAEVPDPC